MYRYERMSISPSKAKDEFPFIKRSLTACEVRFADAMATACDYNEFAYDVAKLFAMNHLELKGVAADFRELSKSSLPPMFVEVSVEVFSGTL